ncbi:hypothetical protein B0H14DRAFT_3140305 [Mycena olivaceomarginata]|nr:hypothetical protein B0H14DRAFT_3140305 [Mycena olivaceomarginata]
MALPNPGINLILGPVILGVIINAFMYGIVFTQAITYYTSSGYKKDSWFINDLAGLGILHSPFRRCSLPGDSTMALVGTSVPIQIFLAWRVKRLSKSWLIFGVLSALSFTSGVMAVTSAIRALQAAHIKVECLFMCRPMYSERMAPLQTFAALIPFGDAWLALSVDTTVHIPAQKSHWILEYVLNSTNHVGMADTRLAAETDNDIDENRPLETAVITRLTIQSIETASFSTINSMVDVITFTVLPNTNFHFVFALLSGRMYTNTLLAVRTLTSQPISRLTWGAQTLNFRTKLREDMSGVHSIPTAIRGPQVVEQRQEVDIALESYPRGRKWSGIPAVSNGSQISVYQDRKKPGYSMSMILYLSV